MNACCPASTKPNRPSRTFRTVLPLAHQFAMIYRAVWIIWVQLCVIQALLCSTKYPGLRPRVCMPAEIHCMLQLVFKSFTLPEHPSCAPKSHSFSYIISRVNSSVLHCVRHLGGRQMVHRGASGHHSPQISAPDLELQFRPPLKNFLQLATKASGHESCHLSMAQVNQRIHDNG